MAEEWVLYLGSAAGSRPLETVTLLNDALPIESWHNESIGKPSLKMIICIAELQHRPDSQYYHFLWPRLSIWLITTETLPWIWNNCKTQKDWELLHPRLFLNISHFSPTPSLCSHKLLSPLRMGGRQHWCFSQVLSDHFLLCGGESLAWCAFPDKNLYSCLLEATRAHFGGCLEMELRFCTQFQCMGFSPPRSNSLTQTECHMIQLISDTISHVKSSVYNTAYRPQFRRQSQVALMLLTNQQ